MVDEMNTMADEAFQPSIADMSTQERKAAYTEQNRKIAGLRKASYDYMDDALRRTEEAIAQSLAEVKDTRAKFQTLTTQNTPATEE